MFWIIFKVNSGNDETLWEKRRLNVCFVELYKFKLFYTKRVLKIAKISPLFYITFKICLFFRKPFFDLLPSHIIS